MSFVKGTKDLSEEGISFTISNPLVLKSALNIKLKLPTSKESLELEGEVVFCKEIRKNIIYTIGVKFVNLSKEQKELLKSFVRSFLMV